MCISHSDIVNNPKVNSARKNQPQWHGPTKSWLHPESFLQHRTWKWWWKNLGQQNKNLIKDKNNPFLSRPESHHCIVKDGSEMRPLTGGQWPQALAMLSTMEVLKVTGFFRGMRVTSIYLKGLTGNFWETELGCQDNSKWVAYWTINFKWPINQQSPVWWFINSSIWFTNHPAKFTPPLQAMGPVVSTPIPWPGAPRYRCLQRCHHCLRKRSMTSTGLWMIQMSCLLDGGFKCLQSWISWNTECRKISLQWANLKFRWTQISCSHLDHRHWKYGTSYNASMLVQSTKSMEHLQKAQILPASGPPFPGSRWPEALSLLDTMQRVHVQRDVVAWNAVMSACENLGECLLSMM